MKFDDRDDEFIFSTGKKMYAHAGVLGLSEEGRDSVYERLINYGYDGRFLKLRI